MCQKLYYMDWKEFEEVVDNILKKIKDQNIHIDTIIPILRGGAYLGNMLNHNLKNTDIAYIHVRRSDNDETNAFLGTPVLKGITNAEKITGRDVIIVDDMLDRGTTMKFVINEVEKLKPKSIKVAVLYNFTKLEKKDMYIVGTSMKEKRWIVYPWEKEL